MNEEIMVRYVGYKARKADNVAGTNVVWLGHGDIQLVPAAAWPKLAKYPDVWALPEESAVAPRYEIVHKDGTVLYLADMSDDAVKDFGTGLGLKVDKRKRGDGLRQHVLDLIEKQQIEDSEAQDDAPDEG